MGCCMLHMHTTMAAATLQGSRRWKASQAERVCVLLLRGMHCAGEKYWWIEMQGGIPPAALPCCVMGAEVSLLGTPLDVYGPVQGPQQLFAGLYRVVYRAVQGPRQLFAFTTILP